MARPNQVFSRAQLLMQLTGSDHPAYERTVDSHVKNLRRKLVEACPAGDYIATVYGVGYKLDVREP